MPQYDYICNICNKEKEITRAFNSSEEPICCDKTMSRLWNKPGAIIFRGSGFYSTDNRK